MRYIDWADNMFSVIEAYEPTKKGDLVLNTGDKVDKIKDLGNGWLIGRNINTRKRGAFPEDCIDRNTSISGALIRRFTNRTRSVKPSKGPRINVIEIEPPDGLGEDSSENSPKENDPENISEGLDVEENDAVDNDELKQNGNNLSQDNRKLHLLLQIVIRILSSVVASGIVYALLVYSFSIDFVTGGYIVAGIFTFLFFGLIFSSFIRCVVLIMVPNMFTKRGKAIVLSVITGLLLSGPAMNISHNTEEVSQSLGCTADLIYNQTRALRKQLEEPIKALRQKLFESLKSLQEFVQSIFGALKPILDAIRKFSNAIKYSVDQVLGLAKKCEAVLKRAGNECHKGNDRVKRKCTAALDKVDPSSKITGAAKKVTNFFKGWGRKKRSSMTSSLLSNIEIRHLVKRGVLSNVCKIFDAGSGVCRFADGFSALCSPIKWLSNAMKSVSSKILSGLNRVIEFFDYKIKDDFDISGSAKSSKSASTIVKEIKEDLLAKTEFIRSVFSIFNRALSVSLLFLFISSLSYVIKYRTKLDFDNKYITRAFIQYDDDCKQTGLQSVLPLRKKEAKHFMSTTSMKLSMAEFSSLRKSAVFMVYHVIITVIIISFDYILYYVLLLIQEYADVALIVEGLNTLDVQVEGNGIISNFVRHLVSSMNLDSTFSVQFNFTVCLPNPRRPQLSKNILIGSLYILAFIFLIMEAYGSRLRRKIASSFYPKHEKNRVSHLHEKIICDRIAFAAMLKDRVFRRRKENEVREFITARGYVSGKVSCMSKCCDCFLPEKRSCHSCDLTARRGRLFVKCQNNTCNAMFCKECFSVMEGRCFVCDTKQDEQDL